MRDKYSDIRNHISVSRFHPVSTRRIETLVVSAERFPFNVYAIEFPVLSLQFLLLQAGEKGDGVRDIISVTRFEKD